ncbi:DUF309 domain-containing protein [Shouchella clausii]|uniref:DUF309 domain-containing protein n=1 Tax=Shouchella clausii TaxID=79880 RepID=UPI000B967407|nr:DUF309 domain-containing protein [Shouchella clausii]AST97955.1 hypothetical protein BC8716_19180 [Shouchella clausii]MCR1289315.1 DUF309 domain-containing protein [Shouchella clausii]MEB5475335.1 DUF309 domain-containing protein [Shouchella clausii]QNM44399.1 DUF309 domain-containing protein [Shouchella clausii]WQG96905.1 DUF309 domain-containing protein [Shouchella clausii]
MYKQRYLDFLYYFHAERDYFECHEVLEAEWKSVPKDKRASCWVTLIQLAVALYHVRRGNIKGAAILYRRLLKRVPVEANDLYELGLNARTLKQDMKTRLAHLGSNCFEDYNLPIWDTALLAACQRHAGKSWCAPSNLADAQLIHKHILRNQNGNKG